MKLQADRMGGPNAISRHGPDGVIVNGIEHRRSLIVPWQGPVVLWPVARFADLNESHFESLASLTPELIVFGTGRVIRFAKPALLRPLMARRIGIESMDISAACRTYNVLIAEGREVIAALLFESAD